MSALRRWARLLRNTPLHPQWLLEARWIPQDLRQWQGRLLDIGCGDRWLEPHLGAGVDYVALDYPLTGRELYRARPHVFADAAALPFADASFDGVTCFEVLEHVPDPDGVLREIARVLRPGGRAWLSKPFLYPIHDAPFDFQRLTESGLRRSVRRAGLELVELRRSSTAVRSACLLLCLAIAGGVQSRSDWLALPLLLLALPLIVTTNLLGWLGGRFWPDWTALNQGYSLIVRRA